jgi:hypothetical protein
VNRTYFHLVLSLALFSTLARIAPESTGRSPVSQQTISSAAMEAVIRSDGSYQLYFKSAGWVLRGALHDSSGNISLGKSGDSIGPYHEISIRFLKGTRTASIRIYDALPLALLQDRWERTGANEQPFPAFDALPTGLMRFSYQRTTFGIYQFGKLGVEGPWALFDAQGEALLLSPADNFQISRFEEGDDGAAESRILSTIGDLPSGFSHGTIIAAGQGVNAAFETWGKALLALGHKQPPKNDADATLARFGYWTDNGATYYYNYDPQLGYVGTLLAKRDEFQRLGIPLGYMQIDSWWYPKGAERRWDAKGSDLNFGEYLYRASPDLFPEDLTGFHSALGLPLVTHGRWISPASPYRDQYHMSGNVIVDPAFWKSTADYLHRAGVTTYEQDWLDVNAQPESNLHDPQLFLGNMAAALQIDNISIQYCMPLPSHYMASTQYANVRTIRPSGDRFDADRWDSFLYDSRLATAVGLWPWADVFFSSELNNLVVATLSGGPVGVGDPLGQTNAKNLFSAIRADGVLLKPDKPLLPIDAMYVADAENRRSPMVAQAETEFGNVRVHYIFAYSRQSAATEATIPVRSLGITGPTVVYDWIYHRCELLTPGADIRAYFSNGWSYQVALPITETGLALIGEAEKIVPMARGRISNLKLGPSILAAVLFAPSERSVTIAGYAQRRPVIRALSGIVTRIKYDPATHIFAADIAPSHQQTARIEVSEASPY